jgi:hypothetical protein
MDNLPFEGSFSLDPNLINQGWRIVPGTCVVTDDRQAEEKCTVKDVATVIIHVLARPQWSIVKNDFLADVTLEREVVE